MEKLFDSVRAAPVQGRLVISRLSQQVSKRKATNGRKERVANMEIRSVSLPPTSGGTAPLPVQVVHISEPEPPEDAKPWFLITTVAVSSMQVVDWYALRWRIEDRALKSGCEVEETGHHTAARLERVVAINAVIAWRIMTLLARKTPTGPAELLFSDLELLVINDYATKLSRAPKTNSRGRSDRRNHGRTASTIRRPRKSGRVVSPNIVRHMRIWRKSRNRDVPCSVQNRICDDRAGLGRHLAMANWPAMRVGARKPSNLHNGIG